MVITSSKERRSKDEKIAIVEERSSVPPGKARFSRKNQENDFDIKNQHSAELRTVADFCEQLLIDGYVQSYVDFYHLTHRTDPHSPEGRPNMRIEVSTEDMVYIRDNLVKAEVSRRQGNTSGVYLSYNNLAEFYKNNTDWRTSIYFHEKCLEVAQLTTDVRAEMNANHALGTVYQKMNEWEIARRLHERHQELAYSVDILEEVAKANIELHRVYLVLAQRSDNESDFDSALQLYHKCVESAQKCWDKAAEGEANGKIGSLLLARGDPSASLPYLRNHSQIAAGLGDAEGRCRACSNLAWALDMLGDDDGALAELTLVHSISEQAGDALLQAQACRSLGTLYSKVGKLQEAVQALERHFELYKIIMAKNSLAGERSQTASGGNRSRLNSRKSQESSGNSNTVITAADLDLARVYVGISRGNLQMGAYVCAIQSDLSSLLDYKLNRTELPQPVEAEAEQPQKRQSAVVQDMPIGST